jgi:hypothetical protein
MTADKNVILVTVIIVVVFAGMAVAQDMDLKPGIYEGMLGSETMTIEFSDKSKFTVTRASQFFVAGKYKVTKDVIEFTDEKTTMGTIVDPKYPKMGSYKWKVENDKLTFIVVSDKHKVRQEVLTKTTWVKK